MTTNLLTQRSEYCKKRLALYKERIAKIKELKSLPNLAIYVTGSYGRHEASSNSDLDLFFLINDKNQAVSINKLTKTLIDAQLIKIGRRLKFPDFSNEGQYLKYHSLKDMLETLGGREDDAQNYLSARLLLLLESRPLCNANTYSAVLGEIIRAYFRDYHDHPLSFRPTFLVNDILRFWKTMCLNYENKRNITTADMTKKNKARLANLKLKFSRRLICFSTIIPLVALSQPSPGDILSLVKNPPLKRLEDFIKGKPTLQPIHDNVLKDYMWFLNTTARKDILHWISKKENRDIANKRADDFGQNIFGLLEQAVAINGSGAMRYLIT